MNNSEIANKIAELTEDVPGPIATTTLKKFKKFIGIERLHSSRMDEIAEALWDEHSLLFTWGDKAVIVSQDRSTKSLAFL